MKRLNIKIYGIVQGVGFRPFMSRLADACRIRGTVCNKGPYVEVFAEGRDASLQQFVAGIPEQAPERAAILKVDVHDVTDDNATPYEDFSIIESAKERGDIFVSPDIATCDKCRAELFDPHDRRYLHPFINCTACGPRLTILEAMPYDRERTSMKEFPMCEACHEEYVSPESRRYDAQPVCCNDCGPEVYLLGHEAVRGAAAIKEVRRVLAAGGIAAIKGIGGFHLACDATSEETVKRLRALKHRPQKPFAVMIRDEAAVRSACHLEPGEAAMMTGHQKPILLLRRRKDSPLAPSVAPGNPKVGVILPYAPVQMLIFDYPGDTSEVPTMLVMTSGNPSGAPICHNDAEAQEALAPLCDVILSHDRRIRLRADDSVMDWFEGNPYMVRRSRGFAPLPFMLSAPLKGQVLGIGGELKNTFCLASNHLFYPSPYIGDMSDLRTMLALKDSARPVGEKEPLPFGMALMYDANGAVVLMQGSGVTADRFAGVAGREMRSALSYTDQNTGAYTTGDAGSVFQRGSINVLCQKGTPKRGGAVYVRIIKNTSLPNAVVGGFEAEADSTSANTVKLTGCQWGGSADANGVAELVILTRQNV